MKNLIEVQDIKKNYGKKEAVKGISFNVEEDEILGLLGPNGSGKTTTIGMLLGLLKPTSGQIFINNLKLEENRIQILEMINFISPYIELPKKLTVKQNLYVYSKLYKVKNINVPKISEFYKPYIFQRKYKQPYVVGKIACSKDFFIKSSKSKYVSNIYTQSFSHHLRYKNQAILVTYKTINEDNPLLDCRLSGLNEYSPIKVIIDKNLKVKKNANIFKLKNTKIIIFYNSGDKKKIKFLKSKKVKLINVKLEKNGEFDLKKVMSILYQNNIRFLLVEGGNQFTNKMLDKNLFNEFYLIKTDNKLRQSGKLNIKNSL